MAMLFDCEIHIRDYFHKIGNNHVFGEGRERKLVLCMDPDNLYLLN